MTFAVVQKTEPMKDKKLEVGVIGGSEKRDSPNQQDDFFDNCYASGDDTKNRLKRIREKAVTVGYSDFKRN